MKILVTGGVRSGKSAHAEALLKDEPAVTYVAAGPQHDDADWAARVRAHQERRPPHWDTRETQDVAAALREVAHGVLVDCLGTWLTARLDATHGWERDTAYLERWVRNEVAHVTEALDAHPGPVVLVTNEVGLGVVSEHRSGRVFADLLGRVNQGVAASCERVDLCVAGRVLSL